MNDEHEVVPGRASAAGRSVVAGATTRPDTLHAVLGGWARRNPQAVALRTPAGDVSYAELDRQSNGIAAALVGRGAAPGRTVPVMLGRSPLLVASLVGVLKTGAAYTVLDPNWPDERIDAVIGQTDAPVVVTDRALGTTVGLWDPRTAKGGAAPPDRARGEDAYAVLFTSGTTGTARGAILPHRGVLQLVTQGDFASFGPGRATLLEAALPWDGFSLELWGMLATGGTCVLTGEEALSGRTLRQATAAGVSTVFLTTSVFNVIMDEDSLAFTGLDQVLSGGERMSVEHAGRFLARHPDIRLTNCYGPVEGNIFTTTHDVSAADLINPHGIPIGRLLPGLDIRIESPTGAPVPDGEAGELVLRGPRLASGYLGQPDHPAFFRSGPGAPMSYRTGDVVIRRGGVLSFINRVDRQVKIRGARVEPAEIETVGQAVSGVASLRAVVVERAGRPHSLAAFWTAVGDKAADDGAAGDEDVETRLRERLMAALPPYSRPASLTRVDKLPLTANGKLDEWALLALLPRDAEVVAGERPDTEVGRALVDEVEGLLGEQAHFTGVNLFELGLTSLDVARLAMRLERRLGVMVRAEDLVAARDLEDAVRRVEGAVEVPGEDNAPGSGGPVALSPVQTGLIYARASGADDRASLCTEVFRIAGVVLPAPLVAAALQDVQDRHDALRSAYRIVPGPAAHPLSADQAPPVSLTSLPSSSLDEAEAAVVRSVSASELRIEEAEVWRAALSTPSDGSGTVLAIALHHIAFDGWSESVLADELGSALRARVAGTPPVWREPAPTLASLADVRQRRGRHQADPATIDAAVAHLSGTVPLKDARPVDSQPALPIRMELPVGALIPWRDLGRRHGVPLFTVLLAVLAESMRSEFEHPDVLVAVPASVRDSFSEDRAIGCLVDVRLLRLPVTAAPDWDSRIRSAAQEVRWSIDHAHTPFLEVSARVMNDPGQEPQQLLFSVQDMPRAVLTVPGAQVEHRTVPPPLAESALYVETTPHEDGRLVVVVSHRPEFISQATARAVTQRFADLIRDPDAARRP